MVGVEVRVFFLRLTFICATRGQVRFAHACTEHFGHTINIDREYWISIHGSSTSVVLPFSYSLITVVACCYQCLLSMFIFFVQMLAPFVSRVVCIFARVYCH